MKIKLLLRGVLILSLFFGSFHSCSLEKKSPTIAFPYEWLDRPGFGGDIDQQGIAWDEDGFLYIAQDTGGIIRVRDLRKRN